MTIKVLSPQLANQIAAGEVVERPASVVKELVENSLDAGAKQIQIDIENGGASLIRIRDNGSGIPKDELALALARHATSKISDSEDLEHILSLGFRGEALASISSVSRLTLTSRPPEQSEAWQVYAQGREMQATIKPASHPVGSTVEVANLFFNTPARRKFLRTDKTEFAHIDEVIRRIALAKFNIAFTLSHNGKIIRQYRPATTVEQQLKRVAAICGQDFVKHALRIDWRHGDLHLSGWVAEPAFQRTQNDLAYCYINGRMVRDKVINHAIKQAYAEYLSADAYPAFVLFLDLNPQEVDVNVHPTKHEVRFHQARLIHDFICQGITNALEQQKLLPTNENEVHETAAPWQVKPNRAAAGENIFATPARAFSGSTSGHYKPHFGSQPVNKTESRLYGELLREQSAHENSVQAAEITHTQPVFAPPATPENLSPSISQMPVNSKGHLHLLSVLEGRALLLQQGKQCYLLAIEKLQKLHSKLWLQQPQKASQALLIPLVFRLNNEQFSRFKALEQSFAACGFEFVVALENRLTLNRVPQLLRQQNLQGLIIGLLDNPMLEKADFIDTLVAQLQWKTIEETADAICLLGETEQLLPASQEALKALLCQIDWAPLLAKL